MSALTDLVHAYRSLPSSDQQRFLRETAGGTSISKIIVWAITLVIMAGTIFFFGYLGYLRLAAGEDGAVLFAFATTALGAIAGLLAPSPMTR